MSNTPNSPAREAVELPEPHVLSGHYRNHTDTVNGYSEAQVRALLAAKQEELDKMREALEQMVEFFEPLAWGSHTNRADALRNARAALGPKEPAPEMFPGANAALDALTIRPNQPGA